MAIGLRRVVLVTHRWLGLASALVLSIVGLTGAVLALQETSTLRKISARLHESLAIGPVGWWIVVVTTGAAILLQLGGLFLWWKRKALRVSVGNGWRRALFDLHHAFGAIGLILMLTLAATGVGMAIVTPQGQPELRRIIVDLHTARAYPLPIKIVWAIATTGFLIQGVTGLIMWWKPAAARQRGPAAR